MLQLLLKHLSVTDPGFPVGGGRRPRRGCGDSRGGYILKILYVETKESEPLGGRTPGTPRSANVSKLNVA